MDWVEIAASVLTLLLSLGGVYVFKTKKKVGQIRELLEELLEAAEDNNVSKEEMKSLVEKATKIFAKQPTEETK